MSIFDPKTKDFNNKKSIIIILNSLWNISFIKLFFLLKLILLVCTLPLFFELIAHRAQPLTLIQNLNCKNILLNGYFEGSFETVGTFMELLVESD